MVTAIPYWVYIAAAAALAAAAAAVVTAVLIRREKRRVRHGIGNADMVPPLPMSNIIKDKIRKPFCSTGCARGRRSVRRDRCTLVLTEVVSGREYRAKLGRRVTIGRKRSCGIRIKDSCLAPCHCTLSRLRGRLFLDDNDTLNGTIVNGILIKGKTPVFTDDLVLIGNREYKIEVVA